MPQKNIPTSQTRTHCRKFFLTVFLLFLFTGIPSAVYQTPPLLPGKRAEVGPFPVPRMQTTSDPFPMPEGIRKQVAFWKKIFAEYDGRQVVIHDSWHLEVIYDVIDLNDPSSRAKGKTRVRLAREKYRKILENLQWDTPQQMTEEEGRIHALFKDIPESPRFKKQDAKNRIRTQIGHADSFKASLIRSGRYMDRVKEIFEAHDLPEELAHLPMIESSFNPLAVSHAGATGLWQFMKRTGQSYKLKINEKVDERRDPLLSTRSAAKFLKQNHKALKSWPLAITAYNHGVRGMKRAVKQVKSRDIAEIIQEYDGPRFEFASRNFYAEFLAAVDICSRHAEYFGDIEMDRPLAIAQVKLADHIAVETLERYTPITADVIRELNPALSPSVFKPGNLIPKGYHMNVPVGQRDAFESAQAAIPDTLKYKHVRRDKRHRVRKGQTLSAIAKAHKTTVKAFMKLNGIRNPQKIRIGQRLKVPGRYVTLDGKKSPPSKSRTSKPPPVITTRHRVRNGQTLGRIARIYNTSARAIARLNALKNPQQIRAGQLLKIPEG